LSAKQAADFAAAQKALDAAIASDPNKARAAAATAFESSIVALQAQQVKTGTATVTTQTDPLSVRDKPNGKVIGSVAKGTIVDIVAPDFQAGAQRDGFYFIRIPNPSDKIYGMKYGWVSASSGPGGPFLTLTGDATSDPSISSSYIPGTGKPFGFPGFMPAA
jgi:hypothetical protein